MEIRRGDYLATITKERLNGQAIFTYHIYRHQDGAPAALLFTGSDRELKNCAHTAEVYVDFLANGREQKRAA